MNVGKSVILVFFSLAIIVGCSSNRHKVTCVGEDWYQTGYDYASRGESVRRFDEYREQCGDSLEEGAMSAYLDGYTKGLVEYCTYDKGYDRGANDKRPLEICPVEMRALYMQGYNEGQVAHGRRIDELEETMRRHEHYFEDLRRRERQALSNEAEQAGRTGR